jgi:hypothetical protein
MHADYSLAPLVAPQHAVEEGSEASLAANKGSAHKVCRKKSAERQTSHINDDEG